MSEKVDDIFEGTLSRIGAVFCSKPPWPPGSVGATLFRSLLDADGIITGGLEKWMKKTETRLRYSHMFISDEGGMAWRTNAR